MNYKKENIIYLDKNYYLLNSLSESIQAIFSIDFIIWFLLYETRAIIYNYDLQSTCLLITLTLLISLGIRGEDIFLDNFMLDKECYYVLMIPHTLVSTVILWSILFSKLIAPLILFCFSIFLFVLLLMHGLILYTKTNSLKVVITNDIRIVGDNPQACLCG